MTFQSRHVAKVLRTGQMLFASSINDLKIEEHCWFSHDDGNHRDCAMVMDNKTFLRMLKNGEVEFLKTDENKNQLTLSI